jgi:hypothetical protein
MANVSLPQGWEELDEPHPEDGVVANSHLRYRHNSGFEINIWSGVVEDAIDYTVQKSDEYAIELYDESGDYVKGDAFKTEQEAIEAASEAMKRFP